MRTSPRRLSFALVGGLFAACSSDAPAPIEDGVRVAVAPLTLPSLSKVCYDLRVTNGPDGAGDVVWSKGTPGLNGGTPDGDAICSTEYGNLGGGDITYIGPCDADGQEDADPAGERTNSVTIWFDGLYDQGGAYLDPAGASGWQNPCVDATGAEIGCTLNVLCQENADALVEFNFTIMREANQGFFDVAVNFEDIFCSAKVDCVGPNGPLELLFDPATNMRGQTAVLALACTAGATQAGQDPIETVLYRNPIVIDCGGVQTVLDPSAGPGNVYSTTNPDPDPDDAIWQYATYVGAEALDCGTGPGSCNKRYWNVAIGFDPTTPGCTLTTSATAAEVGRFAANTSPPNSTYPWIKFDVDLTGATGGLACSTHKLNDPTEVVTTGYTEFNAPMLFCFGFDDGVSTADASQCQVGSTPCSDVLTGWSRGFGPVDRSLDVVDVAVDAAGFSYMTGFVRDRNDVDLGGGPIALSDIKQGFLAKYSPSGDHVWSLTFPAAAGGSSEGTALALDAAGNVFVTGRAFGLVDVVGTSRGTANRASSFIAKLAPDATLLWSRDLHPVNGDALARVGDVATDGSHVYLIGSLTGSVDLGGGLLTSAGSGDVFLARLDGSGAHVWSQRFGGGGFDGGTSVALGPTGTVFISAIFAGSASFGGDTLVSAGGNDVAVASYSGAGTHLWSRRFGGALNEGGYLAVAPGGDLILGGGFRGTLNLGGADLVAAGGADAYLARLDSAGNHQWSQRFGGDAATIGEGIADVAVAADGSIAVTGVMATFTLGGTTYTLDPTTGEDALLAVFEPSGAPRWVAMGHNKERPDNSYGADAFGQAVAVSPLGFVVGVGDYWGALDFGHGPLGDAGDGGLMYLASYPLAGPPEPCPFTGSCPCWDLTEALAVRDAVLGGTDPQHWASANPPSSYGLDLWTADGRYLYVGGGVSNGNHYCYNDYSTDGVAEFTTYLEPISAEEATVCAADAVTLIDDPCQTNNGGCTGAASVCVYQGPGQRVCAECLRAAPPNNYCATGEYCAPDLTCATPTTSWVSVGTMSQADTTATCASIGMKVPTEPELRAAMEAFFADGLNEGVAFEPNLYYRSSTLDGPGPNAYVNLYDGTSVNAYIGSAEGTYYESVCAPNPTTGLEGFVRIAAGSFTMGSPADELGRSTVEDQVPVGLTCSFWMQATEVTEGQWKARSGGVNPMGAAARGDTYPVNRLTWWSALGYLNALSASEGLTPCYTLPASGCTGSWQAGTLACGDLMPAVDGADAYDCEGYRLPTEAEWEYAARAGTTTATYAGDIEDDFCGDITTLNPIAWVCNNGAGTQPVGGKVPNAWGLHDMLGNVYEWTWDRLANTLPGGWDPAYTTTGEHRIARGGAVGSLARYARAAARWDNFRLTSARLEIGLRATRTAPPAADSPLCGQPAPSPCELGWGLAASSATVGDVLCVPPGTFTMGCVEGRDAETCNTGAAATTATPSHEVTTTRGLWVMETEVTQAQWSAVFGTTPSYFGEASPDFWCGADCPVEHVSWFEAIAFANAASIAEGLTPCYVIAGCTGTPGDTLPGSGVGGMVCDSPATVAINSASGSVLDCEGYRLPTEAEWEYLARGGEGFAHGGTDDHWAFCTGDQGCTSTQPACLTPRNGFGLCDVTGNVMEWVWDRAGLYTSAARVDPTGPITAFADASLRRVHGSGWRSFIDKFLVDSDGDLSARNAGPEAYVADDLGFRLVRTMRPTEAPPGAAWPAPGP